MKNIFYIVALVAICGAAALSFIHSGKLKAVEKDRIETIADNKQTTADAEATDAEIKKEKALLAKSNDAKATLEQSVSSLKSIGSALTSDVSKLKEDMKVQDGEFAELEKTLAEVNDILAKLGGGVTLDTLPEKIQEIQDDKKAKQTKLEELEVAIAGTEKTLAASRAEMDRISKRMVERSSRISGNAMEAVVTAVNQDWGFLVIGAGSNSGFTPQTELLVQRDGKMIGQVRPSSIEPTQTIAEIDLKSLASGVRLQPGDRVILAKPSTN
jgi:septal ring factor EnvC (AmiA/AmiB activator)